jgi:hypothetical protein
LKDAIARAEAAKADAARLREALRQPFAWKAARAALAGQEGSGT